MLGELLVRVKVVVVNANWCFKNYGWYGTVQLQLLMQPDCTHIHSSIMTELLSCTAVRIKLSDESCMGSRDIQFDFTCILHTMLIVFIECSMLCFFLSAFLGSYLSPGNRKQPADLPVSNTRVHGCSSWKYCIGIQILSYINITLHDGVVCCLVNTTWLHA